MQKTLINLPFNKGMNTYNDAFITPNETFTKIENGVFSTSDTITKRYGYTVLNSQGVTDPLALTTFNDELLAITENNLFSYTSISNTWLNKGSFSNFATDFFNIYTEETFISYDMIVNNGVAYIIWLPTITTVKIAIMELASQTLLLPITTVDTTSESFLNPKVVANTSTVVFTWVEDDSGGATVNFYSCYVSIYNPTSVSTAYNFHSDSDADVTLPMPVFGLSGSSIMAYTTSTEINIIYVTFQGKLGTSTNGCYDALPLSDGGVIYYTESICSLFVQGDYIFITAYDSTAVGSEAAIILIPKTLNADSSFWYRLPVANLLTPGAYDTFSSSIVGVDQPLLNQYVLYVYCSKWDSTNTVDTVTSATKLVLTTTVTTSLAVADTVTSLPDINQLALGCNTFVYNGNVYNLMNYQGSDVDAENLQPTYFLMDLNNNIIARWFSGNGGNHRAELSYVTVEDSIYFPAEKRLRISSQYGQLTINMGLNVIKLNPIDQSQLTFATLNRNLYISGGLVFLYDGNSITEQGFNLFPEKPTITATVGGGGIAAGTARYLGVYEWVDATGQLHQSTPGPSEAYDFGSVPADSLDITFYTNEYTLKPNCKFTLYRTVVATSGTTYYKVISLPISSSTVTFTDNITDIVTGGETFAGISTDAVIQSNMFLYTTGGNLENIPLPSSKIIHSFNNRIFAISNEDLSKIFYSKENISGEGLGFSDLLYIQLLNQGENPTALTSMDDKLVLFKPSSVFIITGDGANDLGVNSTFSKPALVSSHVGCVSPNAVTLTSDGCFFNSKKGIYLLDRGLNLSYIGKEMYQYRNNIVNSIVQIPDQNQIRFMTDDKCLVYFHDLKQWTIFSNYASKASTIWNNTHVFIRASDNAFCQETTTQYHDNHVNYALVIETGWLKINIQQKTRVYKIQLLGRKYTDHILKITKWDDYNEEVKDVKYFNSSTLFDNPIFGEETYWGDVEPFGGENDNVYLYNCEFDRQRVMAFKLRFEDMPLDGVTSGSGYSLSNLAIELGVKETGLKKDSSSK